MSADPTSVHRSKERRRVEIAVTVVLEGEEAEHWASTVDLSAGGLRLQSETTFIPGQSVGLVLRTLPDVLIPARVAWVGKAESPQAGQAGFEFLNPLASPVC